MMRDHRQRANFWNFDDSEHWWQFPKGGGRYKIYGQRLKCNYDSEYINKRVIVGLSSTSRASTAKT